MFNMKRRNKYIVSNGRAEINYYAKLLLLLFKKESEYK